MSAPDADWPVLKPFLEATESTLLIAMYDFNADYIATTFINAVKSSDIKVVLTWDDGMTEPEEKIRKKLRTKLKDNMDGWIFKCGNHHRFASAYHEKVAVRDHKAFWLSSGNWSLLSQPDIDPIGDPQSAVRMPDVFVPVDDFVDASMALHPPNPVRLAGLSSTPRTIKIQPVLTPDNYIGRLNELLDGAERSIYLQYAYITCSDKEGDEPFTEMLAKLAELSFKPAMDVKIIVGSSDAADKIRRLAEAGFNEKVFRTRATSTTRASSSTVRACW